MAGRVLIAIPASGASRRLGRAKQLVLLDRETLIHRQCRIALEANVGPVAAIVGCAAERCADAIRDLDVAIQFNESWREGLAASLRTATQAAIDARADGLLLLHVDQFRVTSSDLRQLYDEWSKTDGRAACRAVCANYAGPPVILPASCFPNVLQLRGDVGARPIIESFVFPMLVEVPMPSAPHDMDKEEQLLELSAASNQQQH